MINVAIKLKLILFNLTNYLIHLNVLFIYTNIIKLKKN